MTATMIFVIRFSASLSAVLTLGIAILDLVEAAFSLKRGELLKCLVCVFIGALLCVVSVVTMYTALIFE